MVDVSLRHKRADRQPRHPGWAAPLTIAGIAGVAVLLAGVLVHLILGAYRDRMTLTGLSADPRPVALAIAGEQLAIPANMIRTAATRRGGPVEKAEMIVHWPSLQGYSAALDDAFAQAVPSTAIIFATIEARESALDATERLDAVYAQFFTGEAIAGPNGLVGRTLKAESGYGGEIIFFTPGQPRPFVARCLMSTTPEVPSTCMRDVKFGRGLSLLYRFNRDRLADWAALDPGMRKLADSFLRR